MTDPADELAPIADDPAVLATLPMPGSGRTAERFAALWSRSTSSPSLGRLVEAHHDALAILAEAGRAPTPSPDREALELYAVWAAGGGPDPARLERTPSGWRLVGNKPWCSGATLAQRALVTAATTDRLGALVLVDMSAPGVTVEPSEWCSPAMAVTETRTVRFDVEVDDDDVIGFDDWYLRRSGFWHGAIGVAACWAGAADGVVDRLTEQWRRDPHALAHLGAIDATLWNLRAAISAAADEIDADPAGDDGDRRRRALRVRHVVDIGIGTIVERIGRALGPGPLAHRPDVHRHVMEIDLYRRQCHAERDLEQLGQLTMTASTELDPCKPDSSQTCLPNAGSGKKSDARCTPEHSQGDVTS